MLLYVVSSKLLQEGLSQHYITEQVKDRAARHCLVYRCPGSTSDPLWGS